MSKRTRREINTAKKNIQAIPEHAEVPAVDGHCCLISKEQMAKSTYDSLIG